MKPPADSEEPPAEEEKPDDSTEPPAEEEKPDDGTEPPAEEEKPDDSTEPPAEEEKKPDDGTEPSTEEEKPDDGTETPGEDDNTDSVTEGSREPSVTESKDSGSENTAISTDGEVPASSDSTDGGAGTDAPETSDSADNRIMAGLHVQTGSFVIPVYASENPQDGVTAGTLTDSTDKTAAAPADDTAAQTDTDTDTREKTVTIENITWQSDPSYDGDTEGVYTFTPILPEGYVLAEGASLPEIEVTVDGTAALIQALLERIAALPDAQEYMAKEPDIDSWEGDEDAYEEAYTEWMEGLQEYAGEALAIWEEYEALTEEQQARIPEEALDKLTAWVEIAETLGENTVTMTADTHTCNGITFDAWTSTTSLPDKGNYYLTDNVTLESTSSNYIITNTLNLCLNGKTINKKVTSNYYIYEIHGGTLNLYDCNGSGKIYWGKNNNIKVISVALGGTLNLYGGTLEQIDRNAPVVGVASYDGDYRGGTVNIHGGTVKNGSTGISVPAGLTASSVVIDGGYIGYGTNGVTVGSGTATISGGTIDPFTYAVKTENNGTVKIAGDVDLRGYPIYIANSKSITASGTGVSGLSKTIKIDYNGVADGTVVVKGSTDTAHYQLKSDTYGLAAKNGDLVAVEKTKIHSVTYEKNGGTIENEGRYNSYANGVGLTLPTPTREHYTFGGWYENSNCTGTAVTSISATATGNKTYYAKWTAATYTVTYNTNSGTIANESSYTKYTYGTGLTLPTPTRTGYTFGGWYTSSNFSGSPVTSISTSDTGDKTYYAKWTASTYNVTYNKNSGTIANESSYTKYTYGTGLTLPTPTRTGYTFGGWYDNSGCTGTVVTSISTTATGDKTYYAKWTANSYTVTFDKNGGDTPSTASKSVTYGSTYGDLATVSRTGYSFAGWYTAASGGSKVESNTKVTTAGEHTLYAHWTANKYNIKYSGLDGADAFTPKPTEHIYGTDTKVGNPEKTGYTFAGWKVNNGSTATKDLTLSGTGYKAAITLTATWTANGYKVTLNGNGGSGGTSLTSYTYGTGATLPTNWTKTGYTFAGWYDNSSCTGTAVTSISESATGNKTYYAKWTANKYDITYNGLDGANTFTPKPTEHIYGTDTKVGNPEKTGYTFAGWKVNNGSTATKDLTLSGTGYMAAITLTATWTANKYTVTFNYQGATGGNGTTSKNVTYNGTYGELPTPEKTGYVFKGWYTQTEGRGSQITSTTTVNITDAQTLYAYWKDETAPAAPVLQSGITLPADWTRTQKTIPLTLSDNVAVTELLVKIDNGNYVKVSGFMGGSQTVAYSYAVTEGNHTYHFKAKDAAGNISLESEAFTVMLDTGAPVFSEEPAAKNVTADSADITFTPSEGGKAYWIVDPAGTPAGAQAVISGAQGSTDKGGVNAVTGGTSAVIPVTGLTPGAAHKVYVVLEDAAGNLSVVKEAAFATLPQAPGITPDDLIKDYENEKVRVPESFGKVEVYTDPEDPSGSKIEPGADGTLPVEPGKPIYIRYPEKTEDGVTVRPSEGVKIDIPARPAAPAPKQVTVTDTTVTVKDASDDEEYILVEKGSLPEGAQPDWNDAGQVSETGEFTGLTPNKEYELYVRKKATDNDFASEPAKTEVRTSVTINEPEATGDGAGKPGNTAPKPERPDEGGRTVTYTGTYGEEYTPVIKVGGKEIIPGAGTPDAGDSEMTWDEDSKEGEWKYVYPIPDGATEAEITVEFRKRSITGLSVTPENLTLSADDDANRSAAEAGEITPLTAYLKEKCGVKASYDNRTTGTPAADAITYTTSETFAPKGQTYPYTISAGGKTCTATLTVTPVIVSIRNPDALVKRQKEDGYTAQEAGVWLPAKLTMTYTGGDHTARTQELAVTWDTASIGTDFGKILGGKTVNGTVELPRGRQERLRSAS